MKKALGFFILIMFFQSLNAADFMIVSNPPYTVPQGAPFNVTIHALEMNFVGSMHVDSAQVQLYKNGSTLIDTKVTGSNGKVYFNDLTAVAGDSFNVTVSKTGFVTAALAQDITTREIRADANIAFISRRPLYKRYVLNYENIGNGHTAPYLRPGTENDKRWPDVGEVVTYTAKVINKGDRVITDFDYLWTEQDPAINISLPGTYSGSIAPGESVDIAYVTSWKSDAQDIVDGISNSQTIRFQIGTVTDALSNTGETYYQNNGLAVGSHDLRLEIGTEHRIYNVMNEAVNIRGTHSFEDWMQDQYAVMNEYMQNSAYPGYPAAESGMFDRVAVESITVYEECDDDWGDELAYPDFLLVDGRWTVTDGDGTNNSGYGLTGGTPFYEEYVNLRHDNVDWNLIHETGHQLGMIDLYRMLLGNNPPSNNEFHVQDIFGVEIPYTSLDPIFPYGDRMGGGNAQIFTPLNWRYFSRGTVASLNTHYLKRRGFYGDYLYDTPDNTYIRVLDCDGNTKTGIEVRGYQKAAVGETFDNIPEFIITPSADGRSQLPNRTFTLPSIAPTLTETGHMMKDNPFGTINVVGLNGSMFIKVIDYSCTEESYHWFTLDELNFAYLNGDTTEHTIEVDSCLCLPTPTPSPFTIRVNCGEEVDDITDQDGLLWNKDKVYTPGSWGHTGMWSKTWVPGIMMATDKTFLYNWSAHGPTLDYNFDIANGIYKVTLYFVENHTYTVGGREFSASLEGLGVLNMHDIFAERGSDNAGFHEFVVDVTDGQLNINLTADTMVACLQAISIEHQVVMPTSTFTPTETPVYTPGPYEKRINCGTNSQYIDTAGKVWQADRPYQVGDFGYEFGTAFGSARDIVGTNDHDLYHAWRENVPLYSFDVPNGDYYVRLLFSERKYNSPNTRSFSCDVEGVNAFTDMDLWQECYDIYGLGLGVHSAYEVVVPSVLVTDGTLNIVFTQSLDRAFISAIEIIEKIPPTFTPTVTKTVTLTETPTHTSTLTATKTITVTETLTCTDTPTLTETETKTQTLTPSETHSMTPSNTSTGTFTPTATCTQTQAISITPTPTITVMVDTGLETMLSDLVIFPNPSDGDSIGLTYDLSNIVEEVAISIYTQSYRKVFVNKNLPTTAGRHVINVPLNTRFANGIYYYIVTSKGKDFSFRKVGVFVVIKR